MRHALALGALKQNELAMLEARAARGDPVPMLDQAPEIPAHLTPVVEAFWHLRKGTPRDSGIALSEKITAHSEWAPWISLNQFLSLVESCDSAFAEFCADKDEADRKRRQDEQRMKRGRR